MVPNHWITPLFDAVVEATEEAIWNAIVAAETMVGRDGITAHGLDPECCSTRCEALAALAGLATTSGARRACARPRSPGRRLAATTRRQTGGIGSDDLTRGQLGNDRRGRLDLRRQGEALPDRGRE